MSDPERAAATAAALDDPRIDGINTAGFAASAQLRALEADDLPAPAP